MMEKAVTDPAERSGDLAMALLALTNPDVKGREALKALCEVLDTFVGLHKRIEALESQRCGKAHCVTQAIRTRAELIRAEELADSRDVAPDSLQDDLLGERKRTRWTLAQEFVALVSEIESS